MNQKNSDLELKRSKIDVAVVGGGAAGLATAIFAARRDPDLKIAVLDGARKLGAKILISGGGRCNVTNQVVNPDDFCGGSRHVMRRVLAAFGSRDTIAFFKGIGVPLHVEPSGKMFPDSHRARTVLDALLQESERLGVYLLTRHRVTQVLREPESFSLGTSHRNLKAARVVLATGGRSVPETGSDGAGYEIAQSLGHTLVPQTPALVPLVLDGGFHTKLSGVSQDVEIAVRVNGSRTRHLKGSLLWTHFGVSGPVVLDASRHWHQARLANRDVSLAVNFLPGDDFAAAESRLMELSTSQPRTALCNTLANLLPTRLATAILSQLGIAPELATGQLSRTARRRLVHALLEWPLPVSDSRGYRYAEVTAGGVPLDEIDPRTMESRCCAGLFLVGEILDVDGRIGGFNLQWSWSSAWVAAQAVSTGV